MKVNAQWTMSPGRPAMCFYGLRIQGTQLQLPCNCDPIIYLTYPCIDLDHSSHGDMWPQRPCRITTVASDVDCSVWTTLGF